jgi:sugar/nucleoside kinase (ribokinase family)
MGGVGTRQELRMPVENFANTQTVTAASRALRIAVIGNSVVDLYLTNVKNWPWDQGERVYADSVQLHPGGTGLNVAVAIQKLLEANVWLYTTVGNGLHHDLLRAATQMLTVRDAAEADQRTSLGVVRLDPEGLPYFIHYHGPTELMTLEFLMSHVDEIACASFLYVGAQSTISTLPYNDLVKVLVKVRDLNPKIRIVMDVSLLSTDDAKAQDVAARAMGAVQQVDYFIPNQDEAVQYSGTSDIDSAGRRLAGLARMAAIIKLGSNGVKVYPRDPRESPFTVEPDAVVDHVDALGAGDVWGAAFLVGLADDRTLYEACRIANLAAADCVRKYGATTAVKSFRVYSERSKQTKKVVTPKGAAQRDSILKDDALFFETPEKAKPILLQHGFMEQATNKNAETKAYRKACATLQELNPLPHLPFGGIREKEDANGRTTVLIHRDLLDWVKRTSRVRVDATSAAPGNSSVPARAPDKKPIRVYICPKCHLLLQLGTNSVNAFNGPCRHCSTKSEGLLPQLLLPSETTAVYRVSCNRLGTIFFQKMPEPHFRKMCGDAACRHNFESTPWPDSFLLQGMTP